jgi:cation diffusion facilitator family transporter
VLTIAASAVFAGYEAVRRLVDPQPVHHVGWVAAAAVIGFAGNEVVARYRIVVGRRIGSAALVADGLHARTDGFTSLAVLLGAGGVALGWQWADPVVGLAITVAIAAVLTDAARQVYRRLMDAVDPHLVDRAETTLRTIPGVRDVTSVRMRWIGHSLHAEANLVVDDHLSLLQAHEVAADAEHQLTHAIPRLAGATLHTDPARHAGDHHRRPVPPPASQRHRGMRRQNLDEGVTRRRRRWPARCSRPVPRRPTRHGRSSRWSTSRTDVAPPRGRPSRRVPQPQRRTAAPVPHPH